MNIHVASGLVLVAVLSLGVSACSADEGESKKGLGVHFDLSDEAGAADAGLPTYPGVECSGEADGKRHATHSNGLMCESDEPGTHSVVYKVGTKENQHIVAIKPHGSGTRFSVVHLDIRGQR